MNNESNKESSFSEEILQDPTVLKIHSVEELQQLIKHPETPEDVWVEACNELSAKKLDVPSVATPPAKKINGVRIATIVCGVLLVFGVALSVPLFEQAINTKPLTNTPLVNREAEAEIRLLTKRIEQDPDDVGAWQNRALKYVDLEKYDLAIGDSTKAMQLDPNRPGPLNNRAMAYLLAGQLQLALGDCNMLIKKFPTYSHGYAQRAQVYADMGQYSKAAKDLTRAIDLDPTRPGYYVNRESVYRKLGENDHFKAAEVDPGYFHRRRNSK